LKKIPYLVALMIAFFVSLAAPVAAMADTETGWVAQHQSNEVSAIYAEPVILHANRSGITDTVLDFYAVLPNDRGYSRPSSDQVMGYNGKAVVAGYKDRPGW